MTGRERIRIAFTHAGEPDRVPFEHGLDYDTQVDLSGMDYWAHAAAGHTELSGLLAWADRFDGDLYHYAGDSPAPNPAENVRVETAMCAEDDVRITETTVRTPHGDLRQRRRAPRRNPEYTHEKLIKDPRADWPAFRAYCGEAWPVGAGYCADYAQAGERGAVGVVVHSPIDWWQEYRDGGIQQVIMDLLDEPDFMAGVFDYYQEQSLAYLRAVTAVQPRPDFVMLHGSNCSGSVISPALFETFIVPYLHDATALLKRAGIPSLFHVCGKSRQWLPYLVETDLDVIDALEAPPAGNVDLAEVKRLFGNKLCLKGNVPVQTMVFGTPDDVRDATKRCLDIAAPGGNYMLSVGDTIGPRGNRANVEALIETVLNYGTY